MGNDPFPNDVRMDQYHGDVPAVCLLMNHTFMCMNIPEHSTKHLWSDFYVKLDNCACWFSCILQTAVKLAVLLIASNAIWKTSAVTW